MKDQELQNSFLKFISENQGILHKVCNIYCSDKESKKDLLQEMTIHLWKSFPSFQGKSKISTWIYRLCLNVAITFYRKSSRTPSQDCMSDWMNQIPDMNYNEVQEENLRMLYEGIAKLEKIEKAIILLHIEGKDYDEIAGIMGISKTNTGVKIMRIKSKLESLITKLKTI